MHGSRASRCDRPTGPAYTSRTEQARIQLITRQIGAHDPLSEPLVADGVDTSEHVPLFVPESCRILDLQIFQWREK